MPKDSMSENQQGQRQSDDVANEEPAADAVQFLRYASELRKLHETERAEREELELTRLALRQANAQQLVIVADLKRAYEAERQRRTELHETYVSTIKMLAAAVEA